MRSRIRRTVQSHKIRLLAHDLPTAAGTYARGLTVYALGLRGYGVEICLDPDGEHPNGWCRRQVVRPDMLATRAALSQALASGWDMHARPEVA